MSDAQFMGMLIAAIGSLLAIVSVIVAVFIRPVISLNKTITKLDATLDAQAKEYSQLKVRVDKHGNEIDNHEKRITVIEVERNSKRK